ncbi:pentatricopeptide repeat-containing protein At4g21705, mitochondrial [Neltuma alba]|uniref:pentatricopeptide repeat-containing protein At4g21705, mitochondrial n=1 Tax=Neltuma alba TaxID=207710 RepID=UPI0010A2AA57|nr:pentatricopeptide repeat-containing protein At4g21705, mitochondrial-like [Prosopis alba]
MESNLLRRIATQSTIASRFYYTSRTRKPSLYNKISPLGSPSSSVVPELEDWVYKGNKIRVAELQRIVRDLRKRRRFTQALEVSEWMNKNGVCIFSPTEHAVHLDLMGKVHGYPSAEGYFNSLKEEDKNNKTYGALLNCYTRQHQTEKALSHLQKMKELGLASSPLSYNDIMCLYTNTGQVEKVPDVLIEMKKNKVLPDNFSYRICINAFGVRSDVDGIERTLKEMENQSHIVMDWNTYTVVADYYIKAGLTSKAVDALKKAEERLDKKDGLGYNFLISLYARLGDKTEVIRLWERERSDCKRCLNRDFTTMLESLARLGELDEAEKLLKDWESSGNCYDPRIPDVVITGYLKKGLHEKAEIMLKSLQKRGKATRSNSWTEVAGGYLRKGEMEKAFDCFKAALQAENKEWKPNPRVYSGIISWVGDNGSVEEVEALVGSLRNFVPVNRRMYHALIKAYVRHGKEVDGLLDRMKEDNIDEDEKTKEILDMRKP